jgi:hypothetical protein
MVSEHTGATPSTEHANSSSLSLEVLQAECQATQANPIPGAERYFIGYGLGESPVWIVGWGAVEAGTPAAGTDEPGGTPPAFLLDSTNVVRVEPYGWPRKALWVVAEGFDQAINVTGCDCAGDLELWFQSGGMDPTQRLTLDPLHPGIPVQHAGWREFPSSVIFPQTGCYEITVSWDGGSWRATVPFYAAESEDQ